MGGNAFASGPDPLPTPRMPKDVYLLVKERCFSILREMYEVVDSPIEGPGKEDFGDLDILLFGPKPGLPQDNEAGVKQVAQALGAVRVIYIRDSSSNLAIPWPSDVDRPPAAKESAEGEEQSESQIPAVAPHVQVDVRICDDLKKLQWQLFKHAHGDIWNILGSTIRPFGLTADEGALWLRIPEIENLNRKRAKIFLTSDHEEVMDFIGLPTSGYWDGPFDTLNDLYEYAAQCRMFSVPPSVEGSDTSVTSSEGKASSESPPKRKLKANDRRRMNYRPIFRKWIEEFVPECSKQGRFRELSLTREEVTQQAMDKFDVRKEFEQRRQEFLLERDRDAIWKNVIKVQVPEADLSNTKSITYRGCLLKALKKIILEGEETCGVVPGNSMKDENGFFIPDAVKTFIRENKDAIGYKAYGMHHEAYLLSKEAKAKDTLQAGES
ncbi:unnamed protein product [Clonostachys rhizophaga]|uniref:Uncharacterized protein n=1 Tax=Clonostachys rhizophaga TaxID=160324 RepID=A0A9N9VGC9_9HYPO|nr:unnamed protein product [Clonostachys rhizophaga]